MSGYAEEAGWCNDGSDAKECSARLTPDEYSDAQLIRILERGTKDPTSARRLAEMLSSRAVGGSTLARQGLMSLLGVNPTERDRLSVCNIIEGRPTQEQRKMLKTAVIDELTEPSPDIVRATALGGLAGVYPPEYCTVQDDLSIPDCSFAEANGTRASFEVPAQQIPAVGLHIRQHLQLRMSF